MAPCVLGKFLKALFCVVIIMDILRENQLLANADELDMRIGLLLIVIINKVMINRVQCSEVQKHSHRKSVCFLK